MFAQENCDVSNERNETDNASDNVLFAIEEGLTSGIKFGIVCEIVVTLGEKAEWRFAIP